MPRLRNPDLVLINIRLRRQDIAEARREARRRTVPYQHVIRGWVTRSADLSRGAKRG